MTASCEALRTSLGVYVIGALDPAERSALERHLADCQDCRDELAGFAGLPGLLARVAPEAAEPVAIDLLADRAVAALARRRRTFRLRLAAAAAVVVLAGGGFAVASAVGGGPAGTERSAVDASTHVSATVRTTGSAAGTTFAVSLRGVPPHQRCTLVAVARDGRQDTASSWLADYDGDARVTGQTAIARADLATVRIVGAAGATLVTVPLG